MGQTCGTRAESGYNKGYGTGSTWLQGTPKGAIEVEGGHQASEGQSSKWLPRQACENQVLQVIDGHKDRQKHWRPLFLLPCWKNWKICKKYLKENNIDSEQIKKLNDEWKTYLILNSTVAIFIFI